MGLTIRERADIVSTYRHVAVQLMEMLARWVPTTPELEAKALFGRHVWVLAQHADRLGRRTHELRVALHASRPPIPVYQESLKAAADAATTGARLAAFYDALLPDLDRRYQGYLGATDRLLDEPTVQILEAGRGEIARMWNERDEMLAERPDLKGTGAEALVTALGKTSDFVVYREPAPPAGSRT